jgi:hypothetical protein
MSLWDWILSNLKPPEHAAARQPVRPSKLQEKGQEVVEAQALSLETPLLHFDEEAIVGRNQPGKNPWTLRHAFEGTQVFGETGSGKTSGSGATIATSFLREGFGGLVLTAKANDVYDWIEPGRGFLSQAGFDPNKVIIIGDVVTPGRAPPKFDAPIEVDTSKAFNFLDYEYSKSGRATFNLVQLFLTALESGSQGNTGQEDAYWMDALRQLLTNAIDLVILAGGDLSLANIHDVIQTAPQSREQARSQKWQSSQSTCWEMLEKAEKLLKQTTSETPRSISEVVRSRQEKQKTRAQRAIDVRNFRQVAKYWLLDFAGLADRTRSVIVSTFTSKVTGLTRWPLHELLCSGKVGDASFVDIVKETREGNVVIINLPVKRYNEVGRFAQVLIKTVWQRGIERQPNKKKPVFLWADEAQFFATREDMLFQTTARSSGCATVYLTQNICNYYAMMPGKDPKSATDALLGNLATKIFHANGDPTTNDWAERVFGKTVQYLSSGGRSFGDRINRSTSQQQALLPVAPAIDFTKLAKGGDPNSPLVEALIFQGGRTWTGSKARFNSARVMFRQRGL